MNSAPPPALRETSLHLPVVVDAPEPASTSPDSARSDVPAKGGKSRTWRWLLFFASLLFLASLALTTYGLWQQGYLDAMWAGRDLAAGDDAVSDSAREPISVAESDDDGAAIITTDLPDATDAQLALAGVIVQVVSAQWGPVNGRDAERHAIQSTEKNLLALRLKITNRRRESLAYRSWQTGSFPGPNNRPIRAKLRDKAGNVFTPYPVKIPELQYFTAEAEVLRGEVVDDVVVFQLPDTTPANAAPFQLELPAAMFGRRGLYRFQIPAAMIQPAAGTQPEPF